MMSDRRFPEQHEDLQDRARWDEESPETDEHDERDGSGSISGTEQTTDPYAAAGTHTGPDTDTDAETDLHTDSDTHTGPDADADANHDTDLDEEQSDLVKTDAESTVAHPDVDADSDLAQSDAAQSDLAQSDLAQSDVAQSDAEQSDAPMPAPATTLDDIPASSDSTTPSTVAPGDSLFPQGSGEKLRDRWQHIQIDFVDDPRHAVEEADTLVEQVAAQLTESITANRRALRDGWDKQGAGSAADDSGSPTEQLRMTLQQYRSMLNRLLDA